MEITEVRIKLMEEAGERLHAFCSITFDDCFVIRDLKIIEGTNGPFVAMPSRKLTSHCPQCGYKNHLRAGYCNQCGTRLKEDRAIKDEDGRAKLYADIAHPINSRCREMIQDKVIQSYHEELRAAKLPGYVSRYDDYEEESVRPPHHTPAGGNSRGDRAPQRRDVASDGRPRDATVDGHPRVAKPTDQTKVEPAATEPRPPHKAPAPQRAPRSSERPRDASGGFGDGIF